MRLVSKPYVILFFREYLVHATSTSAEVYKECLDNFLVGLIDTPIHVGSTIFGGWREVKNLQLKIPRGTPWKGCELTPTQIIIEIIGKSKTTMSLRPSTAPPIQDMPPPGGYKKVRRINLLSPLFGSASVVIGVSPPNCSSSTRSHTHTHTLSLIHVEIICIYLDRFYSLPPRTWSQGMATLGWRHHPHPVRILPNRPNESTSHPTKDARA